jgi:hypothetical protein
MQGIELVRRNPIGRSVALRDEEERHPTLQALPS